MEATSFKQTIFLTQFLSVSLSRLLPLIFSLPFPPHFSLNLSVYETLSILLYPLPLPFLSLTLSFYRTLSISSFLSLSTTHTNKHTHTHTPFFDAFSLFALTHAHKHLHAHSTHTHTHTHIYRQTFTHWTITYGFSTPSSLLLVHRMSLEW